MSVLMGTPAEDARRKAGDICGAGDADSVLTSGFT